MGAFHAYDIRGIYGVDFDAVTAYKVGYFIPGLLGAKQVLVGRDCRVSSLEIHDSLVQGLTDAGADVYDLGLSTTPMVYFGTARFDFKASIQITASHNPPEYNGMKVSRENALPVGLDNGLGQIQEWIEEGRPTPVATVRGQVFEKDIRKDYLEYILRFIGDYSCLKIAMDLSNGMASLLAREVFGDKPFYINEKLDGTFPGHDPNPLIHKNVEPLEALVRETGADIGVIFDGDADRVMFVDDRGCFISPDLIIALMGLYFIDECGLKGTVLQDIRSSKAVGEFLTAKGVEMSTWKVGRAFAAPRLREIGGLWGGELAGHYYFKDFFYSDSGLLAAMIVLRVAADLKRNGSSVSALIDRIRGYENSGEINFRIEDKQGAMDAVRDMTTSEENPTAMMDFDGYRVEFPRWWFSIRPSNTEPYLRFICEAADAALLEEKTNKIQSFLEKRFGAQRV